MKRSHKEEIADLKRSHQENTDSIIAKFMGRIEVLEGKLLDAVLSAGQHRRKRFAPKSERRKDIGKDHGEDRDGGEADYDGTPQSVSESGNGNSSVSASSPTTSQPQPSTPDSSLKKIIAKLKRRHPEAEITLEPIQRSDYGKAEAYVDGARFYKLEDYFTLPEGERYVMRGGKIDLSYVRVIIRYPERLEESVYEVARVRSRERDEYMTSEVLDLPKPVKNCMFDYGMLKFVLMEKYCYHTPFEQIIQKLRHQGMKISSSTFGDNVHKAVEWLRSHMCKTWESAIKLAQYLMLDETPITVGCESGEGRKYLKKYAWAIRANKMRLVWFVYENGSRGAKVIEPFLKDFIGFYTTDGYQVYKIFDQPDDPCGEGDPNAPPGIRKRSACLVHIRRYLVDGIIENKELMMMFIDWIGEIFAIDYHCKKNGFTPEERLMERLKKGSTITIMERIEKQLIKYKESDYAGCGALTKKALKYALHEWPAMKRVLESGDVELSNDLAEQMMRRIKMNLKTAGNIGSEDSAQHNAFMFSLIESCKMNGIAPEDYITFLLRKLAGKNRTEEDYTSLLPNNCPLALCR